MFSPRQFLQLFRLRFLGLSVIVAVVLAGYIGLARVGKCDMAGRMLLKGNFSSVEGVKRGTTILLAGTPVGTVCDIKYLTDKNRAQLTMAVRNNLNLADDSTFAIVSYGLSQPKVINITPGGSFANLANGNEIIYTSGSVAIEKLLLLVLQRAESKTNLTKNTP